MAKNRNKNKKKRNESAEMDITSDQTVAEQSQAMDTSESTAPKQPLGSSNSIKMKRGVQMKRSKNVRKMKAMAKAISLNEKSTEKTLKNASKTARTQSAKKLYD